MVFPLKVAQDSIEIRGPGQDATGDAVEIEGFEANDPRRPSLEASKKIPQRVIDSLNTTSSPSSAMPAQSVALHAKALDGRAAARAAAAFRRAEDATFSAVARKASGA